MKNVVTKNNSQENATEENSISISKLKFLSNSKLLENLESLALEERRLTSEILYYLREVEVRTLFAELGFSSLYEFCVKYLHYSEGSAHRRISAMRVLRDLPVGVRRETDVKIRSGAITLTNLSLVHGFLKTEKKEEKKDYSIDQKLVLLAGLEHQSKREVEKKLALIQPKILSRETERVITDSLIEIKFIADESLMRKLKRVKEVTAHSNSDPTYAELLHRLVDEYLKRHDPVMRAERVAKMSSDGDLKSNSTSLATKPCVRTSKSNASKIFPDKNSRYIPAPIRHEVWIKNTGSCSYVNSQSGQKCGSKFGLEIEHRMPFALGGTHVQENLTLLCRAHNNYAAKRFFIKSGPKAKKD